MWIPARLCALPVTNFPQVTDSMMANGEIWKSSQVFGPIVYMIWLVLEQNKVVATNLSLANSRVPMGLSCGGSQNHSYSPQGLYDSKLSPERTKELHASSHCVQMCVHALGLYQWRLGACRDRLGFQLILAGKHRLPLFPRFPLPSMKTIRQIDIMVYVIKPLKTRLAVQRENWVQVSALLCVFGQDTGLIWR